MKNYSEELDKLVKDFKDNFEKFNNGNKTAGTRARKSLQDIKLLAQEARLDIQNTKNNM